MSSSSSNSAALSGVKAQGSLAIPQPSGTNNDMNVPSPRDTNKPRIMIHPETSLFHGLKPESTVSELEDLPGPKKCNLLVLYSDKLLDAANWKISRDRRNVITSILN
jgi:hypothetical protein